MKPIRELKRPQWQKLGDFKKLKIREELLLRKLKSNKWLLQCKLLMKMNWLHRQKQLKLLHRRSLLKLSKIK
jgi:hypothetical protein